MVPLLPEMLGLLSPELDCWTLGDNLDGALVLAGGAILFGLCLILKSSMESAGPAALAGIRRLKEFNGEGGFAGPTWGASIGAARTDAAAEFK
jgi:hypothetical protein